jgi:large subunit ribosomal protein L17
MSRKLTTEKLGRKRSYGLSLRQNQIRTLFNNGILKTTTPRAKAVRSVVQSLLSDMSAKEITLAKRRKFKTVLGNKELVEKAIKYAQNEDYGVRVIKVGFRSGDNAQLSRVELIGFEGKRKRKTGLEKEEKAEKETPATESKKGRKPNKDIAKREPQKSASGKATKASRKATERVRTRSGL